MEGSLREKNLVKYLFSNLKGLKETTTTSKTKKIIGFLIGNKMW